MEGSVEGSRRAGWVREREAERGAERVCCGLEKDEDAFKK